MRKLFLASSFSDVADVLARLDPTLTGKRVTFIPTASVVEKVTFYVKSGKRALERLGMIVDELEVSTASRDEITDKLSHNDVIYVSGGNTFFLMQALQQSGAGALMTEQVAAGKLYIGESAGSMAVAPNIEYASVMDSVKKAPALTGFEGLNLADLYPVPHHTNAPFKAAAAKIIATYGERLRLYPISNHEAIWVCGDEVAVHTAS